MPDDSFNHGNNVENNYGTIHQYLGEQPRRKPVWDLPKRGRVAVLGGLATALLGAWGFYAQGAAHLVAKKAYYCASGGHVKYHTSAACSGLSSCTARVASITMARVRQQRMEPCHVCH